MAKPVNQFTYQIGTLNPGESWESPEFTLHPSYDTVGVTGKFASTASAMVMLTGDGGEQLMSQSSNSYSQAPHRLNLRGKCKRAKLTVYNTSGEAIAFCLDADMYGFCVD